MSTDLQTVNGGKLTLVELPKPAVSSDPPSMAIMLQTVIDRGVTKDNIDVVERIVGMYAQQQFAQAFAALQNELPAVQATKAVPNKDGSVRYKFAPYEAIMRQVQPFLSKHGFSVRFSSKTDDKRVTMICTLMHAGGHSVSNEFSVRIGSGPMGSSESQADGSAATYAQRGALCDSLNIVVRTDSDARLEGAPITAAQAADLERRVHASGSSEESFLRYAGAKTYKEIPSAKYADLDANLRKKEKTT